MIYFRYYFFTTFIEASGRAFYPLISTSPPPSKNMLRCMEMIKEKRATNSLTLAADSLNWISYALMIRPVSFAANYFDNPLSIT